MSEIFSNIVMWILQLALAFIFVNRGLRKIFTSKEAIRKSFEWMETLPSNQIKVLGMIELLSALGLVLPFLLGLFFFIVPLAAIALATINLLALYLRQNVRAEQIKGRHNLHRAISSLDNLSYLVAALYIAIGRFWQLGWIG